MKNIKRGLELLSPAANSEVAKAAVLHGADAVYIGATGFGARKNAANTLESIREVVDFAHQFRARVYVTVNTIVYEDELREVERMCRELYRIGVDALIVQDMALLRLDLPPIALHASTQCDIRTPEKAKFLQDVGFSQLVLARELTIPEIKAITAVVDVPVECFIHGALCVSYSGRCHVSCAITGRSANRGECAQLCRLPYTLKDDGGQIVIRDKYLLSLRDFNATPHISKLIEAGVTSFKIEGRLKDAAYVKNITAHYNLELNRFISQHNESYRRTSVGVVKTSFIPDPVKSFNRGFTDYFLGERKPSRIASLLTPKSLGESVTNLSQLNNGDGISYFDSKNRYCGVNINRVDKGRIITAKKISIPQNAEIRRTSDVRWNSMLEKSTSERKINLSVRLTSNVVEAKDERGVRVILPLDVEKQIARSPQDFSHEFKKLGNTIYRLTDFSSTLPPDVFIPRSYITNLRRRLIETLDQANLMTYPYNLRRKEELNTIFPYEELSFGDNVANTLAEKFYYDHGVKKIEKALEVCGPCKNGQILMTTRHCILRELGMCRVTDRKKTEELRFPLRIYNGNSEFTLDFDCRRCEMHVCKPKKSDSGKLEQS